MRAWSNVLLVLLCWQVNAWGQEIQQPLRLSDSVQYVVSGVQFLEETGTALRREQVASSEWSNQWQALEKNSVNLGVRSRPVWVRFDLINTQDQNADWLLEIRWPMLESIEFSVWNHSTGQWTVPMHAGQRVSVDSLVPQHRFYLLPFDFSSRQRVSVYLRVKSAYIMFLPMAVWDTQAFEQQDYLNNILYGVVFGIMLAMMLYNLSLYAFTREASYLYYSICVFSLVFYLASVTGYGQRFLWTETLWLTVNSYAVAACLSFISAALFIRAFLKLKKYGGWVLWLNTALVVGWVLMLIGYLWGPLQFIIYCADLLALVSCTAGIATSNHLWRKGNASAKYYSISWLMLILGMLSTVLMMEGVLQWNGWTEHGQTAGFVAEVLLLSYALAARINHERKHRESAQSLALQLTQQMSEERESKLEAQAHALSMQQKTNEELERRVLDRTREIERAMQKLETANQELAKLSVTDPLTKLHNRRYLDQVLLQEIQRSIRTQIPVSLLLVDIDHFKKINDNYGHLIGDECLKLVATTLKVVAARVTDLVARYGGEEFGIVLSATGESEAADIAEKIRLAIEQIQFIHAGKRIAISASAGVAGGVMAASDSPGGLIAEADKALYRAKHAGRNRIVCAGLKRS